MRIGNRTGAITLQRQIQIGRSKLNEPNMVWQDWRTDIWCEVTTKRGKEHFDPGTKQRYSEEVWLFESEFEEFVGVDTAMRLLYESNTFDIRAVLPKGRESCVLECLLQDSFLDAKPVLIEIKDVIKAATAGSAYSGFKVTASGGTAPYAFSDPTSSLPHGVTIDTGTGQVSGTPTAAGTYHVSLTVTDAAGDQSSTPLFSMVVA